MAVNRLTLTYTLLAQLKDKSSNESTSLINLFVPVVKKAISDFFEQKECLMCENISDIKSQLQDTFSLDMPVPVLRSILKLIECEINDAKQFKVYSDGACIIQGLHNSDLDELLMEKEQELCLLQNDFQNYCSLHNIDYDFEKLEQFIRSQQIELFTNKSVDYTNIESEIPKYVELKLQSPDNVLFNTIANIFIGGIVTDYITLKYQGNVTNNTELLLDTNFIISLIDLNSEDAKYTCNDLYQLCKSMGFHFSILEKTVEQINILLNDRISHFDERSHYCLYYPNDILTACVRRKFLKTDLEFVQKNLKKDLEKYNINIILDAQTQKYLPKAKSNPSIKIYAEKRRNAESALLDSLAEIYVRERRGKNISSFTDIKCWFLHNSTNVSNKEVDIKERWSISANELLTMLWLTNPAQHKDITSKKLTKSCLAAYISKFREFKSPEKKIVKALTERANRFAENGDVTEECLYALTSRMVEGGISNEEATELVEASKEVFINKLGEYKKNNEMMYAKLSDLTVNEAQLRSDNAALSERNNDLAVINQQEMQSHNEEVMKLTNTINELENKLKEQTNQIKKYEDDYSIKKNKYIDEKVTEYCSYYKKWFNFIVVLVVVLVLSVIAYLIFENSIVELITRISGSLSFLSTLIVTIWSKIKKNIVESDAVKTGLKAILTVNCASTLAKDELLKEVKEYYAKQYDESNKTQDKEE